MIVLPWGCVKNVFNRLFNKAYAQSFRAFALPLNKIPARVKVSP